MSTDATQATAVVLPPCASCSPTGATVEHDVQIGIFWIECSRCFTEAAFADVEAEAVDNWIKQVGLVIHPRKAWAS